MRVRLVRPARVWHKAGETVDVSPAEYVQLTSTRVAVAAPAEPEKAEEPQAEKLPKARGRHK